MNEHSESTVENEATAAADAQTPASNPADSVANEAPPSSRSNVSVKVPEFATLQDTQTGNGHSSISRFYDVNVTVSAELGRVSLPIGELLQLTEGSVLELNRPVSTPVDLVAQGVRIARGEVVVVDDCFAIRIKELEPPDRKGI